MLPLSGEVYLPLSWLFCFKVRCTLYRSLSEDGRGLDIILIAFFCLSCGLDIIMPGKGTFLLHFFTFLVGGFGIIPEWQVKWWMQHENEQRNQLCATSVKALCYICKTFTGVMDVVWKHCKQGWMDPQLRWHFKHHSISFKRTTAIKIIKTTKNCEYHPYTLKDTITQTKHICGNSNLTDSLQIHWDILREQHKIGGNWI